MQKNSNLVAKNEKKCPEFEKDFRCFPCFLQLMYVKVVTAQFFMCIKQSKSSKMCKLHSKSCANTQLLGAPEELILLFHSAPGNCNYSFVISLPATEVNQGQGFILQEPPPSSSMASIFNQYLNLVKYFGSKKIPLYTSHLLTCPHLLLTHDHPIMFDMKKLRERF